MFQAHLKTGLYFILLDDLGTMPDISPLSYNAAGEKVLKYSSIFTLDQCITADLRMQKNTKFYLPSDPDSLAY